MGAIEIVSRVERRRKWLPEDKAALLAEIEAEGGRVKLVARRHGISESLLYNWRSAWKAAAAMHGREPVDIVPIGVIGPVAEDGRALRAGPEHPLKSCRREDRLGMIEIALPSGTRVSVDAFVNEQALARVLQALKEVR